MPVNVLVIHSSGDGEGGTDEAEVNALIDAALADYDTSAAVDTKIATAVAGIEAGSGDSWQTITIPPHVSGGQKTIDAEIEAAFALFRTRGGGTLNLPSGSYMLNRRHFLPPQTRVIGGGRGQTLIQGGSSAAGFVVGYHRVPIDGTSIPPGHHFDLFGKLDTSAVGATNSRFGLATRDPAFVGTPDATGEGTCVWGFPASPLAMGCYNAIAPIRPTFWQDQDHLTIEFGLLAHATGKIAPVDVNLFGTCQSPATGPRAGPVCFWYVNSTNKIALCVTTGDRDNAINSHYTFDADSTASVVQKYAVQINLVSGTVTAGAGTGTTLTRKTVTLAAGPGLIAGQQFCPNYDSQFTIGSGGSSAVNIRNFQYGGATNWPDIKVCGIHYTWGRVYVEPSVGSAMSREDGQAINDARRFFGGNTSSNVAIGTGSGTIAYLPLTDKPYHATTAPYDAYEPLVSHGAGSGESGGSSRGFAFHGQGLSVAYHNAIYPRIEELSLIFSARYSVPIIWGQAFYGALKEVESAGGWYGVGSLEIGANYTNHITGCRFQGGDAALYIGFTYWHCSNTTIAYVGRYGVRCKFGNTVWRDILVGSGQSYTHSVFCLLIGGHHVFEAVNHNEENTNAPNDSQIYIENAPNNDGDTLSVNNYFHGLMAPTAVCVHVVGVYGGDGWAPGHVTINDFTGATLVPAIVKVTDPFGNWAGKVSGRRRGGIVAYDLTDAVEPALWVDETVPKYVP